MSCSKGDNCISTTVIRVNFLHTKFLEKKLKSNYRRYESKVEIISTSKTVGNFLSKTIIELFQISRFFLFVGRTHHI